MRREDRNNIQLDNKKEKKHEKVQPKESTKKTKKRNKSHKFITFILILTSFVCLGLLFYLNVLPTIYMVGVTSLILIIDIILWFFLCCPKIKISIKNKSLIFAIILIVIYGFIDYNMGKTIDFLSKIKSSSDKVINYSVVVNTSSSYTSIDDLRNKKMGYYQNNEDANSNIPVSVDFDSYKDLNNMYKDLLNKKIDSLVIEDSLKSMLEDENADLVSKTKVLYTFSVKEEDNSTAKAVDTSKQAFNIYVSGIDTYGDIASVSRSDVNIILTVNPNTKTILMTSIPRDYYVQLHGKTGLKDKLTHAGIYGVDTSIATIEDLLDIDINYYIKVNFTSLVSIVDTLGGITVNSDYSFTSQDGYKYTKGENKLNGKKALSFARERHAFTDGDRQRGKNQEALIKALIAKATSPAILTKYDSLLTSISNKIQTNMPQKDMTSLVKLQLKDGDSWNVLTNNLDGTNGLEYTYSYSATKLYVMLPSQDSIDNAKEQMQNVADGNA